MTNYMEDILYPDIWIPV